MSLRAKKSYRIIYISLALLGVWILAAQCLIQKERWSDNKAARVFKSANVPLELRDTVVAGHHLHYAMTGSAELPCIVFIHGSPGSWMHYMKYLRDTAMRKQFRVVAIDRPGFGYSDFGKAMHLTEQANVILPVLQSIKTAAPMFLVGHSMGGPVAVKLAADNPTLFKTVVIVAGAIDIDQEAKETWRKLMNVRPLYWCLPGAFGPSNTELLYLKKDLLPLQKDFERIRSNVLFVHGDKDTWVPIKNIAFGQKMLVNAASVKADTIRGADHQIPWKNRAELIQILLKLN